MPGYHNWTTKLKNSSKILAAYSADQISYALNAIVINFTNNIKSIQDMSESILGIAAESGSAGDIINIYGGV